jgi:hypothetical protein
MKYYFEFSLSAASTILSFVHHSGVHIPLAGALDVALSGGYVFVYCTTFITLCFAQPWNISVLVSLLVATMGIGCFFASTINDAPGFHAMWHSFSAIALTILLLQLANSPEQLPEGWFRRMLARQKTCEKKPRETPYQTSGFMFYDVLFGRTYG